MADKEWCDKHADEQDRIYQDMQDESISNSDWEKERDEYLEDREKCTDCKK